MNMIIGQLDYLWPRASFRKGREVKLGARPRAREKEGEACPPSSFLARPSCFPRAHILFPFPLTDQIISQTVRKKWNVFTCNVEILVKPSHYVYSIFLIFFFHVSVLCFNVLLKLSIRDNVL